MEELDEAVTPMTNVLIRPQKILCTPGNLIQPIKTIMQSPSN